MTTKAQERERHDAADRLREWLTPGDRVYTVTRHVSASGMTRAIEPFIIRDEPQSIQYSVARLLGDRINPKHGGIVRGGCGMDMGFDLVYSISRRLFPDGFACIGERCPSNDHANGDRDYTPGHVVHRDGGYALNQRWL